MFMDGKITIVNYSFLSMIIASWFVSFFTLSSDSLKLNIGIIYLSPMVMIPLLAWAIYPSIRRPFLNGHIGDKNFSYIYFAGISFILLMIVQTILSDWPVRAASELTKTLLFFFVTHIFFATILKTRNILSVVRLSLLVSAIFLLYLAYLYLYKFQVFYIASELGRPNSDGRNTLALYVFVCIVMATSLIKENRRNKTWIIDYFLIVIFLLIGFLTGSRFGIVFPIIFFVFTFIWKTFSLRKNRAIVRIFFCCVTIASIFLISFTKVTPIGDYFLLMDQLYSGKSGGDNKRLILLKIGFECFANNNILLGHGVKNYLTCVQNSSLGSTLILHNEYLSLLNNVGLIGFLLWIFIISTYSKIFYFSRNNYLYRSSVLVYLLGLLLIDGYNSPMFAVLLAFSRYEWTCQKKQMIIQ